MLTLRAFRLGLPSAMDQCHVVSEEAVGVRKGVRSRLGLGSLWAFLVLSLVSWGRLGAILVPSWAIWGPTVGPPWGYLGQSWAILGNWKPKIANTCQNHVFLHAFGHPRTPPTARYQESWGHLGPILGPIGATVGQPWAILGHLGQVEADDGSK